MNSVSRPGRKLSSVQRECLRKIYELPGQFVTFHSGWPTYEALRYRGLITITPDPDSFVRRIAVITERGRAALGLAPFVTPAEEAE